MEIELASDVAERTWIAVESVKASRALSKELEDTKQLQQISNLLIEKEDIRLPICSHALMTRERVIIEDIENCTFEISREDYRHYRLSGIVSMQTTPLFSRSGCLIGMLSTHWKKPHLPSARDLVMFDVLARQASDLVVKKKAQEARR